MGQYKFTINGKSFDVKVDSIEESNAKVNVNGVDYDILIDGGTHKTPSAPKAPVATGSVKATSSTTFAPVAATPKASGNADAVTSPLPGVVLEVCVREGQSVKRGQKLIVIEAMKMENDILAEKDGTISIILVQKGDSVLEGAELIKIA